MNMIYYRIEDGASRIESGEWSMEFPTSEPSCYHVFIHGPRQMSYGTYHFVQSIVYLVP